MGRAERKAIQDRLLALRDRVEAELRSIPGVVGVGVGFKERGGDLTEEIVFRVYVEEKRPLDDVPPAERIPDEIHGVKTDVLTVTVDTPQVDTSKYRPIKGGIQIGNGSGSVGTLGCLAKRNAGGDVVVVSNHHVLLAGGVTVADDVDVGQPDYSVCCCCGCNEIGKVLNGSIGGLVDCAIASVDSDVTKVHEIAEIGAVAGSDTAVVGDIVRKRGRTTGLTSGSVIDVAYANSSTAGHSFTDQIRIAPSGADPFVSPGDSGSAVVNETNHVVGIVWGASNNHGTASSIANVMAAMDINVPGVGGISSEAAQLAAAGPATRSPLTGRASWEAVVDRFMYDDFPLGRIMERHRAEIWGLIQQRRAVTVVWHRRQGPAFVAAFHRTATVPGYRVPDVIHDVSFTGLLLSMAAALEEHGSPALKRDVRRYGGTWIQQLQDCRTADELLAGIEMIEAALESEDDEFVTASA